MVYYNKYIIIYLPFRFKTPTGTMTVGGFWFTLETCCKGGTTEQYSIGLLGFGWCAILFGELPVDGDIASLPELLMVSLFNNS